MLRKRRRYQPAFDDLGAAGVNTETEFAGFPRAALAFLAELAENNDKAWFEANRAGYEEYLLTPARACVTALGPRLQAMVPNIHAEPKVNGSIMRINRDTRFSRDKSPYRPWLGLWFWQGEGRSRERPGFYFQLGAETLILGAGTHTMSPRQLESYRDAAIDPERGAALRGIIDGLMAGSAFDLGGRHYKRVPNGFDADHPNADLLLHKGLYVGRRVPVPAALHLPGAVDYCIDIYENFAPLLRWLAPVI